MGLRTVIRGGVGRVLSKGFELQLGPDVLAFETDDEFRGFLKLRAAAAADSLAQLKNLPPERLERQLRRNERIYKHTLGLLLQVVEHDTPVDMLWRDLDISELPDEQQWPAILFAVSSAELPDELKRETIERFVEFLRERKMLINRLMALAGNGSSVHQQTAEVENSADLRPAEDDSDRTGAAMTSGQDYRRMGAEPLTLVLAEDDAVNLYLSRWKISLSNRAGTPYVEENGNSHALPMGTNTIGRASSCNIALPNAPLDVSRKHLSIERLPGAQLVLRDLSSKGTWIPARYLKKPVSEADATTAPSDED